MPAAVGGIACKVILLLLAMMVLIIIASSDNSLYTTPQKDDGVFDHADTAVTDALKGDKEGWGLFKNTHNFDSVDSLGCDDLKSAWRGMQAACIIGIIGLFISVIVTLTYLKSQDDTTLRCACGCCGDIMGILGVLTFIILIIIIMKSTLCNGDRSHWHDDSLDFDDVQPGSFGMYADLAYGIYLLGVALLFVFISVCIGVVSRKKAGDGKTTKEYREMDKK